MWEAFEVHGCHIIPARTTSGDRLFTSRGRSVRRGRVIVLVRMFVCLSVCRSVFKYTVENTSSAALVPRSPEMSPHWRLLAALLSQFSHNHPV